MPTKNLKMAYILGTFPQLTQTFVNREITWVYKQNVDIHIFSLSQPKTIEIEEQSKHLISCVRYAPFFSGKILKAQLYFLSHSPQKYLTAFFKTIWHNYHEPKILFQTLAIFPKSVYFAQQIEALEIEHIHAHFITLAATAARITSDLLGISYSIHVHAVGLFKRNSHDVRRQLEHASRVVTISNYHRDYIAKLCPNINQNQIEVVYCSLETDRFQAISKQPSPKIHRILSVGRLIEKKGFKYLIDACAEIAKLGLLFQCDIVGEGPLKESLQARIEQYNLQNCINLLGSLKPEQVLKKYQESDIFVLACVVANDGNRDGLPVVLIEAMSCELPVITTPVTGIVDLVEDQQNGLLVKEKDTVSLAVAIERLIKDENLCKYLGTNARSKVLKDFQIQNNAAKLADIFRKIVTEV
ncbi:group 1 glycosyl transferase [Calothrix sp. NIES-2100]|uniref:glycosyltransferase n=1 Tax=Calothrix sp. NIES-2100 TaxID=1954172 RepID=UPI000B5FDA6E|nr:group 1 glycosyl transferase [Calothrix sp. NIES-2100]